MNVKTNAIVTLRFSLAWSDGTLIDIRKQTGLTFILTMPDDTTITITDCGYDALNNQVWVRIADTHTGTEGTYKGNLSVFTTDLQMVTSGIVDLFTTSADGTETDAFINLFCTAIETPVNNGQGYSPKIVNGEWYVYDDSKKAYVATGQSVDGSNTIATKIAEYDATFSANETERDEKVDIAVAKVETRGLFYKLDDSEADLNLGDEQGNIIARFSNGDISTKNFTSRELQGRSAICRSTSDDYDLTITDSNGNAVVAFKDGHVITKNFNSNKVSLNYKVIS